jgi:fibronectin type 3 domain-containing protein
MSYAAQISLTWEPPVHSTGVIGYMIHYGTASGVYSQHIDIGNTTSHTVNNLNGGRRYYFAVTAYDQDGQEGAYSNEVRIEPSGLPWLQLLLGN